MGKRFTSTGSLIFRFQYRFRTHLGRNTSIRTLVDLQNSLYSYSPS